MTPLMTPKPSRYPLRNKGPRPSARTELNPLKGESLVPASDADRSAPRDLASSSGSATPRSASASRVHPGLTCSRALSGEVSLTPTVRTPSPEVESTIGRAASHDIEPGNLAPSSEVELPAPRARVTRVPQREDRTVISEDDDVT